MQTSLNCAVVERLVSARDLPEAWQIIRDVVHSCGFDHLMFATNRLRGTSLFGEQIDTYMISDLPDRFMKPFWEQDRYRSSALAIWAMQNAGVRDLRSLPPHGCSDASKAKQEETKKLLSAAGVTSGYVMGFNTADAPAATAMAFLNFGQDHDAADRLWMTHGRALNSYAAIFQLLARTLPIPLAHRQLTRRQNEVLRWVGAGKTTAEIATILGLSPATVEKHLRQVRDTLGVSTTTQAVLHAQINWHIFTEN